jgi:hypothetical protein
MKTSRKILQTVEVRIKRALLNRHLALDLVHPFPGENRRKEAWQQELPFTFTPLFPAEK